MQIEIPDNILIVQFQPNSVHSLLVDSTISDAFQTLISLIYSDSGIVNKGSFGTFVFGSGDAVPYDYYHVPEEFFVNRLRAADFIQIGRMAYLASHHENIAGVFTTLAPFTFYIADSRKNEKQDTKKSF